MGDTVSSGQREEEERIERRLKSLDSRLRSRLMTPNGGDGVWKVHRISMNQIWDRVQMPVRDRVRDRVGRELLK